MYRIPRTTALERLNKKRQQQVIDLQREVESLRIKLDKATQSNASYINERNTFYVETFKKMGIYDSYMKRNKNE